MDRARPSGRVLLRLGEKLETGGRGGCAASAKAVVVGETIVVWLKVV